MSNWIMTYSGVHFPLQNPTVDHIVLRDMAHSLSMNCRFTGHTKWFYSVAMHCLLGTYKIMTDGHGYRLQLLFMLHDASETWYNDIAKPLKPLLREYGPLEKRCMEVVWEAFGIEPPTPHEQSIIDYYDVLMFQNEIRELMPNPHEFGVEVLNNVEIEPADMKFVEELFYDTIQHLRAKELTVSV